MFLDSGEPLRFILYTSGALPTVHKILRGHICPMKISKFSISCCNIIAFNCVAPHIVDIATHLAECLTYLQVEQLLLYFKPYLAPGLSENSARQKDSMCEL